MAIDFSSKVQNILRTTRFPEQQDEKSQDIRLEDSMPDIGRIIGTWGQFVVRGKEWRSTGLGVSCGVRVWVLYEPEGGGSGCTVETWIPFQMKWECTDEMQDGMLHCSGCIRCLDARFTGARRMVVRTCIGVTLQAFIRDKLETFTVDDDGEVELLEKSYPVKLAAEAGENRFSIEDTIELPENGITGKQVVYQSFIPILLDKQLMGDKIVYRGEGNLHVVYENGNGELESFDRLIPFSQYSELEGAYDSDGECTVSCLLADLEIELSGECCCTLRASLIGQYVIYAVTEIKTVEDMYSIKNQIEFEKAELQIPSVLDMYNEKILAEACQTVDCDKILDVYFIPASPQLIQRETQLEIRNSGVFQILVRDGGGCLQCYCWDWEKVWELTSDESVKAQMEIRILTMPTWEYRNGSLELEAPLCADVLFESGAAIPTIRSAQLTEPYTLLENSPSLILRTKGSQTLWEIGKRNHTRISDILAANHIEEEPDENTWLLIPCH